MSPEVATPSDMRPDIAVLLQCARRHMGTEPPASLESLLRRDLPWSHILQSALQHGLLPLLAQSLRPYTDSVPPDVMAQLKADFHLNAQHNMTLIHVLKTLLDVFEMHDIAAMPYKGPVLAACFYDNILLRQFSDLDIVIHKRDFDRAKSLLVAQGFEPWRAMTEDEERRYLDAHHAYTFVRQEDLACIDLHWDIAQKYFALSLDPDCLWERLETVSLSGKNVLTLPVDDLLLVLCVHGAKHTWERLGWICDVAMIMCHHPELNWESIFAKARRIDAERLLILGVRLATDLFGAPLPPETLGSVHAHAPATALAGQISDRLCSSKKRYFEVLERFLLYPRMRERWRDRLPYARYHFRHLLTPTAQDRAQFRLPFALSPLYYPLRLMRLAHAYALAPLYARQRTSH